jgi:hypothetical protein
MRGRLSGIIKSMTRDNTWVHIAVDTTGAVVSNSTTTSPDAKASGAEITLRVKPVMGDQLKFGEKIYFTWSTEEPGKDELAQS